MRYFISILVLKSSSGGRESWLLYLVCLPWCLVIVAWLFLAVQLVCRWFVIVVIPDHTHLLLVFCECLSNSLLCVMGMASSLMVDAKKISKTASTLLI